MKLSLVLLVVVMLLPLSSAFQGSSANYNVTISNINFATGDGASANYNASFSLVQQPVEAFQSSSYQGNVGFYYATERFLECFYSPDIYMIALLLSLLFFIVSVAMDETILKSLSGMFLIIVGIAIMINGVCVYNDWLTRSIAFILLGLGLIQLLFIWLHFDKQEEEF